MMRNILEILFVYFLFDYGKCCEDNWNIKSDTIINKSSVIFKNTTITGTSELLSWTWFANSKAVWSSSFFRKFNNEIRGGGFVYMNTNLKKRHLVSLKWMQNKGQDISWTVSGNPEISQISWKISIPKVLTWGFTPTDENQWDFNIDNFVVSSDMVKRPSIEEYPDMDIETSPLRVKREEREELLPESESEDMMRGNKSANARNWIKKAVNFFFGEGDEARGQKPGIFTTVGRWMRNIACKISQQCCSTGEPTPDFVTQPPMRPDSMHPSTTHPPTLPNPPSFEPTSSSAPPPPPPEPSPSSSPEPEPSPSSAPPPSEPSPSIPEAPEETPIENMETLDAEMVPEETRQNDI